MKGIEDAAKSLGAFVVREILCALCVLRGEKAVFLIKTALFT
jgi:hypothetical protein